MKQAAFELRLKHSNGHHFDPYVDFFYSMSSTISLVLVAHLFSQASQASLHPKLLEKIEEAEGMFA